MYLVFLELPLTVGGIKRSGLRSCVCIPRDKTCQRATMLRIPLKPLCFMTACYALAVLVCL